MTQTFVIYVWWTIKTSTNTTMFTKVIFGLFWPPKGPKKWPKMKILQNDQRFCDLHPKISAQTDKRFLRYSIFKTRGIWLAKSFLAIFRAKKLKIVISLQRIKPEKSFCTLSSLEMASFDDFLGLFCDCDWAKGPKKGKTKKSYRLVFQKIAQTQKNNDVVTVKVYYSERPYQSFV